MDNKENVINIKPLLDSQPKVDKPSNSNAKYHSNPIFKKNFVISAKYNTQKFTIADLFE